MAAPKDRLGRLYSSLTVKVGTGTGALILTRRMLVWTGLTSLLVEDMDERYAVVGRRDALDTDAEA